MSKSSSKSEANQTQTQTQYTTDNRIAAADGGVAVGAGSTVNYLDADVAQRALDLSSEVSRTAVLGAESVVLGGVRLAENATALGISTNRAATEVAASGLITAQALGESTNRAATEIASAGLITAKSLGESTNRAAVELGNSAIGAAVDLSIGAQRTAENLGTNAFLTARQITADNSALTQSGFQLAENVATNAGAFALESIESNNRLTEQTRIANNNLANGAVQTALGLAKAVSQDPNAQISEQVTKIAGFVMLGLAALGTAYALRKS